MTEVFRLCDDYITRWAALDPVSAGMVVLSGVFGAATDYGPDGYAAREELIATTLAALGAAPVTSEADRLAASFLRERLEAQLAWHRAGEPLRLLRTPIGQLSAIRDSVDLLPRDGDESWRNIAARLAAFPAMFASWRASLNAEDRFQTWSELSTVFHEGVPGHHLQAGAAMMAGDGLSRYAKSVFVSGHGEGWALYAERLADELGWFAEPGTRLGMLSGSALRAARVVIDIGFHLDLPRPDGSRWTFERACEVLRERGRAEPHRVHPEVVRYFGWPGQAISYKLGERGWLSAREQAMRRPGEFDLKRWHTAALSLGPIGMDALTEELARVLFRPVVDDPAHLAQRTLDGLRGQDARRHRDADGVLDPRGEFGAGAGRVRFGATGPVLHVHGELVHPALPGQMQLEVRGQRGDAHDQLLDLGREQVDPAQDDDVVGPPGDLLHPPH